MILENEELDYEKKRLVNVLGLINTELLNYKDKKKEISKYILDNRKQMIEEYKDDEDQLMEFFDHERFVKEEAYSNIERRLKELVLLISCPYFGRIDFLDKEYSEEDIIYIGRFGLTENGKYAPMIIDWRAPVAALFYAEKLGTAYYNPPSGKVEVDIERKRQFIIKKSQLKGMFDSALDVKDEVLQMVLSKNAGEKLKDIIMTIQAEQDEIIRQDYNKSVVVNGVAGSGKTTVALHRVAYLLYNFRDKLQDKVLILGPNAIFMEYISTVLPSLGEVQVKQLTFMNFAINIISGQKLMAKETDLFDLKLKLKKGTLSSKSISINGVEKLLDIMNLKEYMERIFEKDEEFVENIKYKHSKQYITKLDEYIKHLNEGLLIIEALILNGEVIVKSEKIEELCSAYQDMPLFRRVKKIKSILISRIKDNRDAQARIINKEYKDKMAALSHQDREDMETSLNYERKERILDLITEVIKCKKSLKWTTMENALQLYNQMNNFERLTIDDLAPILYIKIKLEGFRLKEEIKHVVIDEAQDYSELQLKVIKEITASNYFTIAGDENQRMISTESDFTMDGIGQMLGIDSKNYNLNRSYRSTGEIIEYANKYLNKDSTMKADIIRRGEKITTESFESFQDMGEKINSIIVENNSNYESSEGYESMAIVCKGASEIEKIRKYLKKGSLIKIMEREDIIYNGGTVLVPSYYSKGMEFDAVIFIDEGFTKEEDNIRYVMATRALHKLFVFKLQ